MYQVSTRQIKHNLLYKLMLNQIIYKWIHVMGKRNNQQNNTNKIKLAKWKLKTNDTNDSAIGGIKKICQNT